MEHSRIHHVVGVFPPCGFDNIELAVPVTGGMDPIADSSNLPAAVMQQEHMRSDRVVIDPHSGHAGDIHKAFVFLISAFRRQTTLFSHAYLFSTRFKDFSNFIMVYSRGDLHLRQPLMGYSLL